MSLYNAYTDCLFLCLAISSEVLALLVVSHADVTFLVMFRDQTWALQLNGTGLKYLKENDF